VRIADRLATGLLDGVDHLTSRGAIRAGAINTGTDVIDDDLGPVGRE
jgi:hypothetical protein